MRPLLSHGPGPASERSPAPDCALVHGGLGAVMASLAHGVPILCMPLGREQGENVSRVAACGAGEVLAADASVDIPDPTLAA